MLMLGKTAIAGLAVANLGVAALVIGGESAPTAAQTRDVLVRERGVAAAAIVDIRCTRRTSALYGERTYHCEARLARPNETQTLSFVLTAFDRGWALADR